MVCTQAGLPNHDLLMLIAQLSEALETLALHEVSPKLFELMQDFFEQKWLEGKLSELFTDEDIHDLLALLSPYVGGLMKENYQVAGSSQSRSISPVKLKAKTANEMARPG